MLKSATSDSGFVLQIERGQTRFPERPVNSQRFLIGAGSNCHLQLGGDVPLLHSIILPEADHLWIDAVSPVPPLLINGQPQREAALVEGDVLEIASYVFTVGYKVPAVEEMLVVEKALAERSAAELIALLEVELDSLEKVDASREAGASALLQAARQTLKLGQTPPAAAGNHHRQLLEELRLRAESLDLREAILQEHARQLEATQAALQKQLDAACSRMKPADPLRLTA